MSDDLSMYGFKPVLEAPASATVANEDLSAYGFKPIAKTESATAQASIQPPVPNQMPVSNEGKQTWDSIKSVGNSVIGNVSALGQGYARGAGDLGFEVGDAVADLLTQFETTKSAGKRFKAFNADAKSLNTPSDTEQQHPLAASIGAGTGYVAGLTGLSRLGGTTVPGQMAAQGSLGSVMAGEGNRGTGFATGAVIPAVASKLASSPASYLAANSTLGDQVTKAVTTTNKATGQYSKMNVYDATNEAFSKFKTVPGAVNTSKALAATDDYLSKYVPRLTSKQAASIEELHADLKAATNLEEMHIARKAFTSSFGKVFLKGENALEGKARAQILALKSTVEAELQANAKQLGALDKYTEANNLFKQSQEADLLNKALKSSELPEGGNRWLGFVRSINKLEPVDSKKFSTATKQMLEGIKKTATEANHIYGIRTAEMGIVTPFLSVLKGLAETSLGKAILQRAGSETGRKATKEIFKSIVNVIQAKTLNSPKPTE